MRGDAQLRTLARAAAAGDVEAQARELLERVRAGTLATERLELAAYAGHRAAQLALGVGRCACGAPRAHDWRGPEKVCPVCTLERWAMRLCETWEGHEACWQVAARAALAAAAYVVGRMAAPGHTYRGFRGAQPLVTAGRAWLASPENGERDAWARRWLDINATDDEYPPGVRTSSWCPAPPGTDTLRDYPGRIRNCGYAVGSGDDDVRAAVQQALIAWALGPAPAAPAPHVDPDPELPPTPAAALAGGEA